MMADEMTSEEGRGNENTGQQIVLIDAGNTNTVFGVYRGDELVEHLQAVDRPRTHRR